MKMLFSLYSPTFRKRNLVPRAFPSKNGWGAVTVIWASPRFGHPHSHIPSVLGIPKTLIASTLPKLFQTREKSGLSITNFLLNSVNAF